MHKWIRHKIPHRKSHRRHNRKAYGEDESYPNLQVSSSQSQKDEFLSRKNNNNATTPADRFTS
jgi:hypothetical protein